MAWEVPSINRSLKWPMALEAPASQVNGKPGIQGYNEELLNKSVEALLETHKYQTWMGRCTAFAWVFTIWLFNIAMENHIF